MPNRLGLLPAQTALKSGRKEACGHRALRVAISWHGRCPSDSPSLFITGRRHEHYIYIYIIYIYIIIIFKRLRATAGQGPNYVGPSRGYVGLSWPSLGLCWPILKAMWADLEAYVGRSWGPCWPMWSQKIRKMARAKNTVKRRIFWWSAAYLGAMLAHLGAMLAYLEGNVGPSCWPILGLCWPILGAMLPHLEAMLIHLEACVGPCWPILSHKIRKMEKMGAAKNTVKRGGFWRHGV